MTVANKQRAARPMQVILAGLLLVLGCEAAPGAEPDVTKTEDVLDSSAGKDSAEQGSDAAKADALVDKDLPKQPDVPSEQDVGDKKDLSEGKDIEEGKDVAESKDGEPGKDIEEGKDTEPGKDIEEGKDTEPGKDIEEGKDTEPGKDIEEGKDSEPGKDIEEGKDTEPGKDTDEGGDSYSGDDSITGCIEDSDCPTSGPCWKAICENNKCGQVAVEGPCDDGNDCTKGDFCKFGQCQTGQVIQCSDGNPCTTDSCAPGVGCVQTPNTNLCNDGDPCTLDDVCVKAVCTGKPKVCEDKDPCTTNTCEDGDCVTKGNLGPCDDGDPCTAPDNCTKLGCKGTQLLCDDNNPCTKDACWPEKGCQNLPILNGLGCNDGLACTTEDTCWDGSCAGVPVYCSDGAACTEDQCSEPDGCVYLPDSAQCADSNVCTADLCAVGAGCSNPPLLPELTATLWATFPTGGIGARLQLGALGPDELLVTTGASLFGSSAAPGVRRYQAGQEVFFDPLTFTGLAFLPTTQQWMGVRSCLYGGGSCGQLTNNLGPLELSGGQLFTPQHLAYPDGGTNIWLGYLPVAMAATADGWLWTSHAIYAQIVPYQPATQTYGTIRTNAQNATALAAFGNYLFYIGNDGRLRRTDASGNSDIASTATGVSGQLAVNAQYLFAAHGLTLRLFDHDLHEVGSHPLPAAAAGLAAWGDHDLALATDAGIYRLTLGTVTCDDGLPCIADTACVDLACVGTSTCDDADPCTTDACTPDGCTYTTSDDLCDDGDACTIDVCETGSGCAHNNVECSDDNPCTVDGCNSQSGCSFLMPMPGVTVGQWAGEDGVGLGHTQLIPVSDTELLLTNTLGPVTGIRVLQNGQISYYNSQQVQAVTRDATGQWLAAGLCGAFDGLCDFGDKNVARLAWTQVPLLQPLFGSWPFQLNPFVWGGFAPASIAATDDGWVWIGHLNINEGLMPYDPATQTYGPQRPLATGWSVVAAGNWVFYPGRDHQLHRTSSSGTADLAIAGDFTVLATSASHLFATQGTTLSMFTHDLQLIGQVTLPEAPYAMTAWGPDRLAIATATGIYTLDLDGAPCDDGDPCTLWDACAGTTCAPGTPDTATPGCLPPE